MSIYPVVYSEKEQEEDVAEAALLPSQEISTMEPMWTPETLARHLDEQSRVAQRRRMQEQARQRRRLGMAAIAIALLLIVLLAVAVLALRAIS